MKGAKIRMIVILLALVIGIPIRVFVFHDNDIIDLIIIDMLAFGINLAHYFTEKKAEADAEKRLDELRSLYETLGILTEKEQNYEGSKKSSDI